MEKWTARNEAGTWYVDADRKQSFFDVCEVFGFGILAESRAHKIAAMPEMEAALEAFVEAWEKSHQLEKTDVAFHMAQDALTKAKAE